MLGILPVDLCISQKSRVCHFRTSEIRTLRSWTDSWRAGARGLSGACQRAHEVAVPLPGVRGTAAFCSKWSREWRISDHAMPQFSFRRKLQTSPEERPVPGVVFQPLGFLGDRRIRPSTWGSRPSGPRPQKSRGPLPIDTRVPGPGPRNRTSESFVEGGSAAG